MANLLERKTIVVMGVINKRSIAWGCADALKKNGARVVFTYQNERVKNQLLKIVDADDVLVECDVSKDENIEAAFSEIHSNVGNFDGLVHSIAFANKEELEGKIAESSREGYAMAQDISVFSLLAVVKYALPYLNKNSSIATMTYIGSERAVPNYNVMGLAKASLEAAVRYLAVDLAEQSIRVNGISAGAVKTLAVTGVKDYDKLLKISEERTPDGRSVDIFEIGNVAAFLMSDLSTGVVGDIIYVDKGVHLT
ncbi:enoyl-ACP reductase FabI [Enterococcus rivorum]|uniref:Enoyl-[acyl-carrier-protein] reductase [NADH] n=1 Tax=Enterococcus rivorum TaxID=762845 RepID=A0A1E5KZR4_9ENTE|nr:enoyl-ACP reductase FabI [Enterococcus rivorum]MBP2099281.1 enoyl-[acyl-carrier protein] reductase I [Enterococcus rivorum]OEH83338.1 enoyl-[acyl-carrier-protein] reductase [Enterococcus rivorum]